MAITESQKKAMIKWQRKNTTVVTVRLQHTTDKDILQYLEGKNKAATIKSAIRDYMEKHPDNENDPFDLWADD